MQRCKGYNLHKYDLKIGESVVSWKLIRNLYESSHHMKLKYVSRLTDEHIYKSRFGNIVVLFAAQVLSNSAYFDIEAFVASTVLPPEAIKTAKFVERIVQPFDSLNSLCVQIEERKMKHSISEQTEHINLSGDEPVDVLAPNIFCYVSGYLVHTFLKKKACEKCTELLKDSSQELSSDCQVYLILWR